MPARKMRVEVYDETGNKYTVKFQGRVTRDKAIRLLDLVELLGGMPGIGNQPRWAWHKNKLTKLERVRLIVEKHFPLVWFSSKEVQSAYEEEFKDAWIEVNGFWGPNILVWVYEFKRVHYPQAGERFK